MQAASESMALNDTAIEEMSEGFNVFDLKHTTDIKNSRDHTVLFHIPLPADPNEHPVPQKGSEVWDGNHVRLPCAHENTYREVDEDGITQTRPRWDLIQQSLLTSIKNSYDLENAIKSYNTKYKHTWNFIALHELMENEFLEEESKNFIEEVLPSMVILALKLPHLIQSRIPLLKQGRNGSISLSQEQVACLLANAFFCTFPRRNSTKSNSEYSSYPDINFNRLFSSGGENVVQKLKCICTYFRQVCKVKMPTGVITFQRRYVYANNLPNWSECNIKFSTIKLHVSSTGRIEKEGTGMLQVDFANKFLGGGVLGHGCVQEEIRFVICPELIVGRLFVESLKSAEAVLMVGCEQYCNYKGYAQTFEWNGPQKDTTPCDEFRRKICSIVAIDALQFQGYSEQYKEHLMRRELNKAYIGFFNDVPAIGPCVASGNWGCGAFGGISSLKALLQLMACVICKRNLSYFTFGDDHLRNKLLEVYKFLTDKKITVSQLWENLREFHYHGNADEPDSLFPFIYKQYEKQNNRMFSKINDNSEQNRAATSAVCKENTSIQIEFPEEKLWDKFAACKDEFPLFNVSKKPKIQSDKVEMSLIQLKEKRKFESFNETFAETSKPTSVTEKKESALVKSLNDSYGLVFSTSKKHRFDDESDSVPDFLAQYLTKPTTTDSETPHCSATNEVNHKLNDMSVIEKKDSSTCSSSKPIIKEIKNVINFDDLDVLEKVTEDNSMSYMVDFNNRHTNN